MVNVVKEQKGTALVVRLTGSIEENVNFDQLIGPPPGELWVNTKEVLRRSQRLDQVFPGRAGQRHETEIL